MNYTVKVVGNIIIQLISMQRVRNIDFSTCYKK